MQNKSKKKSKEVVKQAPQIIFPRDPEDDVSVSMEHHQKLIKNAQTCQICFSILWKPVACKICTAKFCKSCIYDQEHCDDIQNNTPICKSCNSEFEETEVCPLTKTFLSRQEIKCEYSEIGCPQICMYDKVESHQETCIFKPQPCYICQKDIQYKDQKEHFEKCIVELGLSDDNEKRKKIIAQIQNQINIDINLKHIRTEMEQQTLVTQYENDQNLVQCKDCEGLITKKEQQEGHDKVTCLSMSIAIFKKKFNLILGEKEFQFQQLRQQYETLLQQKDQDLQKLQKDIADSQQVNIQNQIEKQTQSQEEQPVELGKIQSQLTLQNQNINIQIYNDISLSESFYDEPNYHLLIGHSKPMMSVYSLKNGKKRGRTGTPGKPSIFSTMNCMKRNNNQDSQRTFFSSRGYLLITGFFSGEVVIWDIEFSVHGIYFQELFEFSIHDKNHIFRSVTGIATINQNVICASHCRIGVVWYSEKEEKINETLIFEGAHNDWVTFIDVFNNNQQIVTCSHDKTIKLWNIQMKKTERVQSLDCYHVQNLDCGIVNGFLHNNQMVISTTSKHLQIWTVDQKQAKKLQVIQIDSLANEIIALQFKKNFLILAYSYGGLLILNQKLEILTKIKEIKKPGFNSGKNIIQVISQNENMIQLAFLKYHQKAISIISLNYQLQLKP